MKESVVVSRHAASRFRERFRLYFNSAIFRDHNEAHLMRTLFEKSRQIDFALKQKPGLYNAICIKYNCLLDYHRYNDLVVFVSTVRDNRRVILTVLKKDHKAFTHTFM